MNSVAIGRTSGQRHRSIFDRLKRIDLWRVGTFFIASLAIVPILALLWLAFFPTENIWPHLIETALPRYLSNTIFLMVGVGVSVFLTGVTTAYYVSHFEFPFRKQLEWLLLLPLAFPAYVVAYLYTDLLEYSGPIQRGLRAVFGWTLANEYWFPNVRSMGGAIMLMGLVLYPYVYLLARSSFLEQSRHLTDVSRSQGRGHFRSFLFVTLPIARPAIAVGVALALMETLNDFGTVDFFAVHTLTAGLYDVWLNMNNLGGAAQIASVMLTFVLLLLAVEFLGRKRKRFYQSQNRFAERPRDQLNRSISWVATCICLLPVVLGFFLPFGILLYYAVLYFDQSWTSKFQGFIFNSVFVSALTAVICVLLAIVVSYCRRLHSDGPTKIAARFASLGYAVPGAVLAVGIIIPFARFDNLIDQFARDNFGFSTGLLFTGTITALIMTYVIRFLAISIGSVESSMSKISESIDMAGRTLGHTASGTLRRFHLPLLKGGMLTAALIVFVDTMKELPATLILRPFNFETLATHVYQFASDEMIEQSALGSLFIVLVGLLPVILLSNSLSDSQKQKPSAS